MYTVFMKVLPLKNPFGAPVYHEEIVSSTFDVARVLAKQAEAHGTVICADFQEAGRGRLARPWAADRGKNLLFTILLRYGNTSSMPQALTLRTGLAVSLAVEDFAPALTGSVKVKWPNDVMITGGKANTAGKAAGILTESDGNNVFIGVGVNVGQTEFPAEYRSKAISIAQAVPGLAEDARFSLLEIILSRLHEEIENSADNASSRNKWLTAACDQTGAAWRERLTERLYKKGETVVFADGAADSKELIEGKLSGIGSEGELLIVPNGEEKERAFITGELRVY